MQIGYRNGTKNFQLHIAVPDWGYWEVSLKTSDENVAKRRADEITILVDKGMKPEEIKKTLVWLNSTLKKKNDITFVEFCNQALEYMKDKKKSFESFYKRCASHLIAYFGEIKLNKITTFDVIKYQDSRRKEVKPATVNRELSVLRIIINLAIKWGKSEVNPVKGVEFYKEPKGRIRFLELDEINKLMQRCADWLKPIVIVCVHTGMRIGEILGLRKDNIDFRNNIIVIDKTKNNEVRDIPMTNAVHKIMLEKVKNSNNCDLIFHTSNETALRYRNVHRAFQQTLERAGIRNFRIHDLRHTFASHFMMAGNDIYTLSKILGHKDVKTTMIYAHLGSYHKRVAMMGLEHHLTKKEEKNSDSFRTVAPREYFGKEVLEKELEKNVDSVIITPNGGVAQLVRAAES